MLQYLSASPKVLHIYTPTSPLKSAIELFRLCSILGRIVSKVLIKGGHEAERI